LAADCKGGCSDWQWCTFSKHTFHIFLNTNHDMIYNILFWAI
jgi:hypothetical protein